jgi:hypothetical protein
MEPDHFAEGYEAHDAGQPETANPYPVETDAHLSWNDGWYSAALDAEGEEV